MDMHLFKDTGIVTGWTLRVLRRFSRVSRRSTWAVIACLTAARITRMLAFLLPLKVILLAGSDGVPRYFRFFISPEFRSEWVVGLAGGAIISYALTLLLEARSKRLSEASSADLLAASGIMAVIANQREQAQGFYIRFTQIASAALFSALALVTLLLLDPVLGLYIAGLIACFYLLTAWALHGFTALKRTWISDFVTLRLGSYLGVLSATGFLSSFLVILYPFVLGAGGNILVAIICVVLLRQALSNLVNVIREAVSLAEKRPLIDALVFPDHQLHLAEKKDTRTLRELFGRAEREGLAATELADLLQPGQGFRLEWRDPLLRGTAEFAITLEGGEAPPRYFLQRVFPARLRHVVENEDLLFSHVEREAVSAPPLLRRFFHGEHECLVWEAGSGQAIERRDWPQVEAGLIADLWSIEPPPALLKVYSSSHSFLHQRLTDEFAMRMEIAVDNDAEAGALARFLVYLPTLRERLSALPLCFVNPRLRSDRVVRRADGGLYAFGWGEWSLEPAGAGLGNLLAGEGELEALLERARERRKAMCAPSVNLATLELARACGLLERAVQRGSMKTALLTAIRLVEQLEGRVAAPVAGIEEELADKDEENEGALGS